jgi:hypothetical protein
LVLTLQRNTRRLPGSFDEELVQRLITERLKRRTSKYTKKLALKFKKVDETKSLWEVDTASSVHSAPEDPSKDANPEPKVEEDMMEDLITFIFGSTEQNPDCPEKLKRLRFYSTVNGSSANRSSDAKKDLSPFDDVPGAGFDNE